MLLPGLLIVYRAQLRAPFPENGQQSRQSTSRETLKVCCRRLKSGGRTRRLDNINELGDILHDHPLELDIYHGEA